MPEEQLEEGTMTFWEHLEELRSRVIKAIVAFVVGFCVAWFFKARLLEFITEPFINGWPGQEAPSLHMKDPAELFVGYIKISLLGGFLFSLPIMLYQLWAFIAPGLYSKEKRLAIPFVVSSCLLFLIGAYFGWRVVFPMAFRYLLNYTEIPLESALEVKPTVMISEYIAFVTRALVAFGAVFEIPVIVFFLSVAGIVNHTHLIKFARYFVVVAFIIGALITPPDPLSQLFMAGPLCLLYGISIGIAYIFGPKPKPAP